MSFQILPLPRAKFAHLFGLSTGELASRRAVRVVATKKPGFPCRVSLADAEVGEEVILANYEHHAVATPYQSSHAVFVRANATEASLKVDEVPELFRSRILSLRAFDETGMLTGADLAKGAELTRSIETMFENLAVSYIHVHNSKFTIQTLAAMRQLPLEPEIFRARDSGKRPDFELR